MIKLLERDKKILDFIIRDYVKTALPVSSERVLQKLNLNLSSATIRNTMMDLEKEGFLEKEHPSSGRVPTDAAYRYFVDNCMSENFPANFYSDEELLNESFMYKAREIKTDFLVDKLSEALNLFIAAGPLSFKKFSSCGSEELLKKPEFKEHCLVSQFGFVIDHLEDIIEMCCKEKRRKNGKKNVIISIGKENYFKETQMFSILSGCFKNKKGKEYALFSLGPRRMDYEKNYSLVSHALNEVFPIAFE